MKVKKSQIRKIVQLIVKESIENMHLENSSLGESELKKVEKQTKISNPPTKVTKAGGKVPSINSQNELPPVSFPDWQMKRNSGKQHAIGAYDEVWESENKTSAKFKQGDIVLYTGSGILNGKKYEVGFVTDDDKIKLQNPKTKERIPHYHNASNLKLVNMSESKFQKFIRKLVKEQLNINESSYGTFYHPIPTRNGIFLKSHIERTFQRNVSVYKLEYLDANGSNIEFSFVADDNTMGRVLRDPETYLDRACDYNDAFINNATRIENIAPGKARKTEEGNWEIITKAKANVI